MSADAKIRIAREDSELQKITIGPLPPEDRKTGRIYNGDMFATPVAADEPTGKSDTTGFGSPGNQRITRRKVSPFNMVVLLFFLAIGIVLYISNIIAVDQLTRELNALENQHRQTLMEQEVLRMQINRMSSLERIRERAEQELSLKTPNEPPVILNIDPDRIEEIKKVTRE